MATDAPQSKPCQQLSCIIAAIITIATLSSTPALAYRRWHTCIFSHQVDPQAPSNSTLCGANQSPRPLNWPQPEITYQIASSGSITVGDDDALLTAARASFDAWNEVGCATLRFVEGPRAQGADDPRDGQNVIAWIGQDWPGASDAFAVTLTTATATGEIVDSDMILNEEVYAFGVGGQPDRVDVRNTLTHEAGHMLGLDHTPELDAVMAATAEVGDINKRALHPDDIEGVCAIFPLPVAPPDPAPTDDDGCLCSSASRTSGAPSGAPLVLLALGWWAARRRRRAR